MIGGITILSLRNLKITKKLLLVVLFILLLMFFLQPIAFAAVSPPASTSIAVRTAAGESCELSPVFSPSTMNYTVYIPEAGTIYITPTMESGWQMALNGSLLSNGQESNGISISADTSLSFRFSMFGENSNWYSLAVEIEEEESPPTPLPPALVEVSGNNISISPSFSENVSTYSLVYAREPEEGGLLSLTLKANDDTTSILVNGQNYVGNQASISFRQGEDISVKVVNGNNLSREYTISTNYSFSAPTLSDLLVNQGEIELSPAFDPVKRTYSATLDRGMSSVNVKARAQGDARVFIDGRETTSRTISGIEPGTKKTVEIQAVKNNRMTDYTLYLYGYEVGKEVESYDTTLTALDVLINKEIVNALPYETEPGVFRVPVPEGCDSVKVSLTTASDDAIYYIGGKKHYNAGYWSAYLPVSKTGETTVQIQIIASDNSTSSEYLLVLYHPEQVEGNGLLPEKKSIQLRLGEKTIYVNGMAYQMDVAPYETSGRTMVPIRFISEYLGADVTWNAAKKTVTIIDGETTLTLTIDKRLEGMDVAPLLQNDRTFVPLRFVSEKLGAVVDWYAATKDIIITR